MLSLVLKCNCYITNLVNWSLRTLRNWARDTAEPRPEEWSKTQMMNGGVPRSLRRGESRPAVHFRPPTSHAFLRLRCARYHHCCIHVVRLLATSVTLLTCDAVYWWRSDILEDVMNNWRVKIGSQKGQYITLLQSSSRGHQNCTRISENMSIVVIVTQCQVRVYFETITAEPINQT